MSAPVAMGTIDTALPDNPTPYEEFSEWVNKHCTPGRLRPEWPKEVKDGAPRVPSMKEAFFVRPADQKKYWTNGKIAEIINDVTTAKQLPAPRAIQRSYIQTFSTLVTACLVPYLNMFVTYQIDDSRMPLSHFPPEWDIKNEMHNSLFGQLKKYQWKFFPQIFDVNMVKSCLDERIILPIEKCERIIIHEDDRHFASTVFRIEVEQSCHHFTSNVYCPFHISSISPLFLDESTALMVTVLQNDERKPSATPNVFALKVYDRETESDQFQREYAALNLLQNRNRNVISFFASFVQGDSSNIIEEYANGGNLWAFFENHDPPANPEDILAFWNSMFKILKGVQTIHSIEMAPRVGAAYFCIHGDLKLDNILRHKAQGSSSNFCFEPKIADFGNADVPKLRSDGEEMGRNQECDPAYSAPERNRTARFLWRSPMSVSRAIDIFSLGCIFTEACVWAVHGCDAFEKFFNKRSADTSPALKDAGYEGCFYDFKDGECNIISYVLDVLKTISGMEVVYLQHRITAKVARIVLQSMLMPNARDRDTIEVLISRFASILEDTKIQAACPKKASVPVPASSRTTSSPELLGSQHTSLTPRIMPQLDCSDTSSGPLGIGFVTDRATSPRQALASATFSIRKDWKRLFFSERIEPTELPSLSVDQVLEYRDKMQNTYGRRNPDAAVKRIVKKLQKYLDNRDQIFFLDDSRSMEKHREDVERTFEALGWIAEGIDDDGIDLFFGDPGSKKLQSGNSRELLEELKKHKYSPTSSNMVKSRLSHLVETELRERLVKLRQTHRRRSLLRLHRRKMPRINVFVFTDGNWVGDMDHTKAAGVDEPVRDLMDMIKELGLSQQDVTIQFVRFGNDKDGIQRLQYLDNFADNTELGNDLVDTEPANGNVYKMFMSSLDREIDLQVTNPLEGYDTEINSSNQTWYTAQESLSRVGSMGRDLEMV
ncbi:hypothetical protein MKZ38_000718 [Zalerion maritima]|uniref:Protein kinase domain-containing protein n=1 Tax=Zalerion maritima TaxID=339359 RepID=A0AAD5RR57_9PEZI|nr:hypothetical protein MKZ38_000718 [Zalerion maritima]